MPPTRNRPITPRQGPPQPFNAGASGSLSIAAGRAAAQRTPSRAPSRSTGGARSGGGEQPYRSPKPIYSEGDYRRQLDQDFGYAERAAGVATANRERLIKAQAAAQSRAQSKAIAAQSLAEGRSLKIKGGIEQNLLDKKVRGGLQEARLRADAGIQVAQIGAQASLDRPLNLRPSGAVGFSDLQNQANERQFQMQVDAQRRQQVDADFRGALEPSAMRQRSNDLAMQVNAQLRLQQNQPRYSGTTTSSVVGVGAGRGGGSFSGGSGGGGSANVSYSPAPSQPAGLSKSDEEQLKLERERMQLQRDMPGIQASAQTNIIRAQGESEEELRRKAAMRALATFNAAKPSYQPAIA